MGCTEPWYLPPVGRDHGSSCSECGKDSKRLGEELKGVDYSLKAHSKITIGYGDGGVSPWSFELPKGIDVDIGYLKLYFTQQATDMRCLEQKSPYEPRTSDSPVSQVANEEECIPQRYAPVPLELTRNKNIPSTEMSEWSEPHSSVVLPTSTRAVRQTVDLPELIDKGKVWVTKTIMLIQRRPVGA